MRHRTPRARGQPLRAVCPRNVVRLFRPKGRNWMPRINSGHPTVRLPQAEAWAERERVPSGHNCRRQLATGRPEQIQEPGTAVPGTPIFANNAQRGGPPLESPCRWLSLVLSFASKESTAPRGAAAPPSAPSSARHSLIGERGIAPAGAPKGFSFPLWKPSDTEAAEKPIGGKFPIRAAAGPSSHRQPKTTRQENSLSRRVTMIFQKINPSLHPPSRRTQCASDTPDRKSRWAGLPASAWPSSRPYPPSRSRLSDTARQWGWSCTS